MQLRPLPLCLSIGFLLCLFSNPLVAATDVEAHYRLDETSGTVAADSSGNGNNGTYVNGPTLGVAGTRGNAAELNMSGTDDRIDLPNTVLDGAMDASFAFWIKTTRTGQAGVISGANAGQNNAFLVFFSNSSNLRLYKGTSNVKVTIPAVSDNQWHHFVWTWDGDTNTAILYRNGLLVNSQVMGGSVGVPLDIDSGGLLLGQEQDCVGGCFSSGQIVAGSLDDVQIYRRVLTAQEVQEIYSGLIAHWTFDQGAGTTIADSTPNASDASFATGSPAWISGMRGGALDFSTLGDTAQTDAAFNPPATGAVAYWMRATGPLATRARIFGLNGNWEARLETTGFISFDLGASPFVGNEPFATTTTIDMEDRWYHIVANFDAKDNSYQVYVDGELEASGISPVDLLPQSPAILSFGTRTGSTEYWRGALDDFRIYDRPLSAQEVSELYGLVGHWNMDEGTGTTAADSTAFANDATLAGATWTTDCAGNNGLEFNGLGDTATTNAVFDPPENGAIAVWLRSAGNPGSRSRPFGVGGNWEIRQESDGTLSFDLGGEGPDVGAGPDAFITTEGLSFVDRWYHLVAQFKAADDSFEVYINGELVNSGVNGDDMVKQLANTLTFGTRTGNTEYWEGGLRDFRVYNRWLDGSEISSLSGLAGYWKLDETSGTVAVDSSPNGNDGIYTGGVLLNQSGQVGQAADFDGTDDYVSVVDDMSLQMDSTFSISAWIRADDSTNVNQMILNKEGEYEIAIFSGGEIHWAVKNTDPGWAWHPTGHIVAIGKWTHIAMTYDNGTVDTYANGVLVDTYSGSGVIGDQYPSLNELRIGGRSNNPPGKYFDGLVDDVRVFSRVMCPEEVFAGYKGGRPAGVRILKWVEVR